MGQCSHDWRSTSCPCSRPGEIHALYLFILCPSLCPVLHSLLQSLQLSLSVCLFFTLFSDSSLILFLKNSSVNTWMMEARNEWTTLIDFKGVHTCMHTYTICMYGHSFQEKQQGSWQEEDRLCVYMKKRGADRDESIWICTAQYECKMTICHSV